jgi:predicted 2-oxoglutarate/Fe(II)-dependent dioxygenase YbiX
MKNNFVIFPQTFEGYTKVCHYSRASSTPEYFFTEDECDRIVGLWNEDSKSEAAVSPDGSKGSVNKETRRADVNWLGYSPETAWIYEKLYRVVEDANKFRFRFDLAGFFEDLQLTRYKDDGGHYTWHEDSGSGMFSIRKLSVVVQLSSPEDYEGGELEVHGHGPCLKERGAVFVFPSFVTHRVTPTTKGIRHSLVAWVSGPAFR